MRVLVLLDRIPFPPSDGVYYPIASHLRGLSSRVKMDGLIFGQSAGNQCASVTRGVFERIHFEQRLPRIVRGGALEREAFTKQRLSGRLTSFLTGAAYDAIYFAPLRVTSLAKALKHYLDVPLILNLNDSQTAKFRHQRWLASQPFFPLRHRASFFLRGLKRAYMHLVETELLREVDLIFVQTRRDWDDLVRDCGQSIEFKLHVARNGAQESLLENPYNPDSKRLVHVGSTEGHRRYLLTLFVHEIFPRVREKCPGVVLDVFGNVAPGLRRELQAVEGVVLRGFVDDLRECYRDAAVSIVPAFMTHGIINRVVDSMAAGVPCSGIMAFNGISGFESGRHGNEVRNVDTWSDEILRLLDSRPRRIELSKNARDLVKSRFRWCDTVDSIYERIVEVVRARRQGV